ncbi:MAG: TIGR04282 family arsenosugar biosynthesis glycosyltransferase [Psychroflexus halocasei]
MTKEKNILLIFARHPELGKCKTRLAKSVGDYAALEVYKYLLKNTAEIVQKIKVKRQVWYADQIHKNDIWDDDLFEKREQIQGDLGEKMQHAFETAFHEDAKKVVIVGTDIQDLNEKVINQAFKKLDTNDVVIGPASDGGYYLLGMKSLNPEVFQLNEWSTAQVFNQTIDALKDKKISILEQKNDVDYLDDTKGNTELENIIKKYK